ncbi:replicative DNA helicase [Gallibacterium genomosp. 2]|uniref:replicative DNA helicase n=1 Tax=Gallibacterium genomosp. 2 TaxID=155517 RepID=UPI00057C7DB7|nr:replicative DNA helicase [Gallibacterium genomosp. 2]
MTNKNINNLFDEHLESAVLGTLLMNNEQWDNISILLSSDIFYLHYHKLIFDAIKTRLTNGSPIDILILEQDLKKSLPDNAGLFAYLVELVQKTPLSNNIDIYVQKLYELKKLRELAELGNTLQNAVYSKNTSADSILAIAENQLFTIAENKTSSTIKTLTESMRVTIKKIESACQKNSSITGIPTGIEELDYMTTGFQPSDFVVIAGRPGMGKTAFLLTCIKATLEQNPKAIVQFYSLEMPSDQILMRLMSMLGNVSLQALRNPLLLDTESFNKLSNAMTYIQQNWENRLLIDDSATLTPEILRSKIRRYTCLHGHPSVIFIDYLQLMKLPNQPNRYEEISRISNTLKSLAKEMQCPVIALSQLNRAVEGRTIKRPTNADLRDSGEIEQDADVIILLHREDYYQSKEKCTGLAEIILGKQRNSPTGDVISHFVAQYSRFESYTQDNITTLN